MKTLIINGSPRKRGDTAELVRMLTERLSGQTEEFNCYSCDVNGCIDCRYCWSHDGCCLKDGWQSLEKQIQECDNIVIASPVYFFELTGKLLDVLSRLQSFWCARYYRKKELISYEKKGGILLAGGGNGSMERAVDTAVLLLKDMRCVDIAPPVLCRGTDSIPAGENDEMPEEISRLAEYLEKSI